MMRHVLGVDGGATKTHALLADETGRLRGFGQAGGSNHQVCGLQAALHEIERAARAALEAAGCEPSSVSLGCFCLAGADLPEDYSIIREAVQALNLAQSVQIKNDTMAALRSGTTRSWGVVVICGTGFNAAGISPDGREIILPALGTISGDWGGGSDLSLEMIRLVMRAWDGRGSATLLTGMVLDALAVDSVEKLLNMLYHRQIDAQRRLDLVPLSFEAAEKGDQVAQELIVRLGTEVAVSANAIIRRLALREEDVEVVLGGSVFKGKGNLLVDTVTRLVQEVAPGARIVRPRYEPVVGAVLLALEAIGVVIDEPVYSVMEESLRSVKQIWMDISSEEHG